MATEIHLRTNDKEKRLSLIDVKNAGHPDYFRATLVVISRGFGCEHPFFFDRFEAECFTDTLKSMTTGVVAEAVLKQQFEEDHITFRNDPFGHVFVSGEVNEYATGHRLAFVIESDQTVLQPFVDEIVAVIAT